MAKDFAQLNQYFARMIKDAPEMMEAIVEDVALRVDKEAKKNCPVDTGNLRASITVDINGDEAEVGTNVEYAPFVEYGTSKSKAALVAEAVQYTATGGKASYIVVVLHLVQIQAGLLTGSQINHELKASARCHERLRHLTGSNIS